MNSKNSDCIMKVCAIAAGTALLLVCLFLYLGDDNMGKGIENCGWVKIILSVVAVLVLGGIIAGIWCCKQNCYFGDYRDFLPTYDSGVVVVRENNTEGIKSCTVTHYDTLGIYADNASDNDTAYVYGSKNTINAETLARICQKENIELRFMDANAKININEKKFSSGSTGQKEK